MTGRRRGVKGAPHEKDCGRCGSRILLIRDVEDPEFVHVLNAEQVEGGTVIRLNDRAQEVPPGRGLGYTRHTCRSTDEAFG